MAKKKSGEAKAELAYARSEAWARSVPGTPYGVTVPTTVALLNDLAKNSIDVSSSGPECRGGTLVGESVE